MFLVTIVQNHRMCHGLLTELRTESAVQRKVSSAEQEQSLLKAKLIMVNHSHHMDDDDVELNVLRCRVDMLGTKL